MCPQCSLGRLGDTPEGIKVADRLGDVQDLKREWLRAHEDSVQAEFDGDFEWLRATQRLKLATERALMEAQDRATVYISAYYKTRH